MSDLIVECSESVRLAECIHDMRMLCDRDGLSFGTLSCRPWPSQQEMTVMAWHAEGDCAVKMIVPSSRFRDKESVLQLTKLFVEKWKCRPRRRRDSRFVAEHFDAAQASGRSRQAREILNRFASRRPWLFEQPPKKEKDSVVPAPRPSTEPKPGSPSPRTASADGDRLQEVMQRLSRIKNLIDDGNGSHSAGLSQDKAGPPGSFSGPDVTPR